MQEDFPGELVFSSVELRSEAYELMPSLAISTIVRHGESNEHARPMGEDERVLDESKTRVLSHMPSASILPTQRRL